MELNDIKKELYRSNPVAYLESIKMGGLVYKCTLLLTLDSKIILTFHIPLKDIGDAEFHSEENAKYLIRWIVK